MDGFGEWDDEAFRYAVAAYKAAAAKGEEDLSVAAGLLKGELQRRQLSVDAAFKRETASMGEAFARKVALLEEEMQREVKEMEKIAAVEKACLDLCIAKMDINPTEAAVYASVLLSWSSSGKKTLPERPEKCGNFLGEILVKRGMIGFINMGPVVKQVLKISEKELKVIAEGVASELKQRGFDIPTQEVSKVVARNAKILSEGVAMKERMKDGFRNLSLAYSVVKTAVTTVNTVKSIPFYEGDTPEPLLNCRHHLPDGWHF